MARSKIVDSFSYSDSGVSKVTIQNKYGRFSGYAFCSPEDMKAFSAFAGERYAQIRATAEYAKLRYKQEKIKLNTINNLLQDISIVMKEEEIDKKMLKRINLKKRDYTQTVEDWYNFYTYLNTQVKKQDEARQAILLRTKENK